MSDVYVLGVDMIKFGRFPDRTVPNIGAEAALMALDDAGLTKRYASNVLRKSWSSECDGRTKNSSRNWPNWNTCC